ncbi:MAG: Fe-S protein assembly co-chaperone HscB [Betaproteobacteria bacterium]|nr:Fe-S protein assembly co-chaperone HscB [Betaproteobacteria bacterium]
MALDFNQDFFELFGLQPRFQIDLAKLEQSYRDIQSRVHPDRFAHLSQAERRVSMQWATRANEAYQTLKRPLTRARYLLLLQGVHTQEETNTAMPAEFLMAQLEWREAIQDARSARDGHGLMHLETKLNRDLAEMHEELARLLDAEKNFPAAAETVRKLRFYEKLQHEIGEALESIET